MKNYAIEWYRFLFAMTICTAHFIKRCDMYTGNLLKQGDMVVEFFFLLSGFFLMKHYYGRIRKMDAVGLESAGNYQVTSSVAATESLQFLKNKLCRLYPHYLLSFVVILIWQIYIQKDLFETIKNGIFEGFMLQGMGIQWDLYNSPTWYISSMLIASYFLMFLLMKNRRVFTHILAPLGIILGYTIIARKFEAVTGITTVFGVLPAGVIRAGAGILIGCISYELYLWLAPVLQDKFRWIRSLIEVISFGFVFWHMIFGKDGKDDFIALIALAVGIISTSIGNSQFTNLWNNRLSMKLGGLSYAIYLNHWVFIMIFRNFPFFYQKSFVVQFAMYLIIVFLYSILTTKLIKMFQERKTRQRKQLTE